MIGCSEYTFLPPVAQEALGCFLFIPDNEIKADVTLVLGMTLWQRPLERALELYHKGLAGRMIFTGGYNERIDMPEAEAMAEHIRHLGVPENDFLVEPHSLNTRENFVYSRISMEMQGLSSHCRMNIVAIGFHMRRALLTAQDVFPNSITMGTASYPSIHYSNADWHQTKRGRDDFLTELNKIATYYPGSIPPELKEYSV